MTSIEELAEFGQSVWLDNISRSMFRDGTLKKMIDAGLRGMTSNPAIFNKALSSGSDYNDTILRLCRNGAGAQQIYDEIALEEITSAADALLPVFEKTNRLDGYVSLEINPHYADDTKASIAEGRRLHEKVKRPNLMVKVPATAAGFSVAEELLALGINVNVTLIFSLKQYLDAVRAYLRGLQRFINAGNNPADIRSVASVFVSRLDTSVDGILDERMLRETDTLKKAALKQLKGKAAVAYVSVIYKHYRQIFAAGQFRPYVEKGAHFQRVLWASTSTKNPEYSDIKYVSELIARDTVNTMPESTFHSFIARGEVSAALSADGCEYMEILDALSREGVDLEALCEVLLKDGVASFIKAHDELIANIEQKARTLCPR